DIDYKRLLREFQSRGYLVRAFYYTAVIEDQEYSSIRPLIDWLDYNGYSVVTKATKEFVDQSGRRKIKGNMDIELAVDAMELAGSIDQMVLFSGDGDFRSLVEAVQRRGVRVVVVSTISTQPPMVADELRRQADQFVDLVELQGKIGRDASERPDRPPREPREPRQHTPQFLQRSAVPQRAGAEDEDFED
ncbi:MAG: NYN domain-containing protein, partial [Xanthobacteraceae bacterium]